MKHDERLWTPLGATDPTRLVDARLQLHWAAQPVAAVGATHLPPADDYGHTTLSWLPAARALATQPLPRAEGRRFALRPADLTLLRLSQHGEVEASLALQGQTLADASEWVVRQVAEATGGEPAELDAARTRCRRTRSRTAPRSTRPPRP